MPVHLDPARLAIASAMFCVVTDPNRRPSSPAWWPMVSTVLLSSSAFSCARLDGVAGRPSSASIRRWAAWTAPLVAGAASLRGIRKLRR